MSQVTISGAISGLDTASLINQLVNVQTNQQSLLKTHQSAAQKRADAYSALATSLTSLGSLAAELAKTSAWSGATATSTSAGVTATASGTSSGAVTFDVTSVARAHTVVSTTPVGSTNAIVATGPLTLTKHDGSTTSVAVGSGSLADIVSAINASGTGLRASAVQTGTAAYRLQVMSETTGAASEFSLDGFSDDPGFTDVLTQGRDAVIRVGTNPATAYDVSSPTNTFAGLVPGLSLTVSKLETDVHVAMTVDGSSVADRVSELVKSTNSILSDIAAKTTYNASTKTGGVFTGESAVRALQQNILNTVAGSGAPGVQLTRDGRLSFDRAAFLAAFASNPAKVASAFGATSSFEAVGDATSTSVTLVGSSKSSRAGSYEITVMTAPQQESWAISPGALAIGTSFSLTRGTATAEWSADSTDLAEVATALTARAAIAGLGVTARVNGSDLVFTADASGSAAAFSVSMNGTPGTQVAAGTDIEGFIDGRPAVGLGDVLRLASGDSGAVGLSLAVRTSSADLAATGGDIGSLTYTPGLAQRLSRLVADATVSSTGSVATATAGASQEVKRYQAAIDAWDDRLTAYRTSLTRQFTAMETTLAQLKSATSALSGLIRQTSSNQER